MLDASDANARSSGGVETAANDGTPSGQKSQVRQTPGALRSQINRCVGTA